MDRYESLLALSNAIGSQRDVPALFKELARLLRPLVGFEFLAVSVPGSTGRHMRLHVLEGAAPPGALAAGVELAVDEAPAGWVWQRQEPLVVPDVEAETKFSMALPLLRGLGIRSVIVLPLTTALGRVGAMAFGSVEAGRYAGADLRFLGHIANQVALALDNGFNFEASERYQQQLARERDRLGLLLEVNNAVVSNLDLHELFAAISASLRRVVDHERTALALLDAEANELRVCAVDGPEGQGAVGEEFTIPLHGTPAGAALESRKPVLISNPEEAEASAEAARRLSARGLRSACYLPLITPRRVLGTLNLASTRENRFTADDLVLLGQVAAQISLSIENALAFRDIEVLKNKLAGEKVYLEEEIRGTYNFGEIVGESPALRGALEQTATVAATDSTVLILGETGTGKELVARAIHDLSLRRERTFVKLNCAAIPSGLLESELFGHERGAFTGAIALKIGRFELAHQGTLFLDEVGDIPLELQPKLLRVLQEKEFERLGAARSVRVNVRLIAATNRDLAQMVEQGQFRRDLYYRINVFPITIPPLRERPGDISLLARHFTRKFARQLNKTIETIPSEAMSALERWQWPGNVRELENVIERAAILTRGTALQVPLADFKAALPAPDGPTLETAERDHILRTLRELNWVIGGPAGAAARLGLKRTTLQSKMRKLNITKPTPRG
jgi:formate hydrogenlyase transcriptional activator